MVMPIGTSIKVQECAPHGGVALAKVGRLNCDSVARSCYSVIYHYFLEMRQYLQTRR